MLKQFFHYSYRNNWWVLGERVGEYSFSESLLYFWCFSFICLNSAWSILLDRSQTRLQIVLISPELFIPVEDDAMERQRLIESVPDSVTPLIIYEETTDIWINVRLSSCTWWNVFSGAKANEASQQTVKMKF